MRDSQNTRPPNVEPPESPIIAELLGSIVARAGFGLVLAKPDRTVIYANAFAKALIQVGHYLRWDRGRITTTDFEAFRKLQSLIVAASRKLNEPGNSEPIVIRNADGIACLIIHVVAPIHPVSSVPCNLENQFAGLLIVECQQGAAGRIAAFAQHFGLTSAEARVVCELVSGAGITSAAARLNIAASTVQTHVKHILEKTRTHRQAELVRVFYDITIPSHRHLSQEHNSAAASRTSLAVTVERKIEQPTRVQLS